MISSPLVRRSLAAAGAVLLVVLLWMRWVDPRGWTFADVAVYVRGGRAVLDGTNLYAVVDGVLPFTYTPFAGVAFVPLTLLGSGGAEPVISFLSFASLAALVVVSVRATGLGRTPRQAAGVAVVLFVAALTTEAVQRTLILGQVNLVLAALVVVDLFVVPPRWRGLLLGLAIAVKLTPAVFLGHLVLTRQWGAVVRTTLAVVVSAGVGAIVVPDGSAWFWSGGFFDLGRFGSGAMGYPNQSVRAALARGMAGADPGAWGVVAAAAVVALTVVAARRTSDRHAQLASVTAVAVGGLLVSPISWTHHWVWVVPIMAVLAVRRWWVALAVTFLVMYVAPMVFVSQLGLDLGAASPWVDATWTLLALAYLGALALMPAESSRRM